MRRSQVRLMAIAALILFGSLATASSASAHDEGETEEGYLLVQQALAHLAHDTTPAGLDLAMEKVDDALTTDDQEGVDVPVLEQGMAALEAGNAVEARSLLQASITEALESLPPATGYQTGTSLITPELPGRSGFLVQEWGFLVASVVVLLLGVWLAFLFRPHDTIRELRSRLATSGGPTAGESTRDRKRHVAS